MNNKLSVKLSGFRENYNTQYCLTYMLEKWKKTHSTTVNMFVLSSWISQKPLTQ